MEGWPAPNVSTPNRPAEHFNLAVVHIVIGPEAASKDLMHMLQNTPAQIAICQCLPNADASVLRDVDQTLAEAATRKKRAKEDGAELPSLGITRLPSGNNAGYVVWQPNKIEPPVPVTAVAVGGHTLEVFHCDTVAEFDKPSTRVTIGVISLGEAVRFSDPFLADARDEILKNGVQFLMGFFGNTSEQISALCRDADAAGTHAACQPWRMARLSHTPLVEVMALPQSERASEAWGMDAQELGRYHVFPAYICCLGRRFTEHQGDSVEKAPDWSGQLSQAFQAHMVPLSRVPVWEPAPQSRTSSAISFGPFKQKPPPPHKWYPGTHQVLLWVGSPVKSQKKVQCARRH